MVSYVPEFLAKTESALRPLPRSFLVKSLADFAAGLDEDLLLCPVHYLRIYLQRTAPGVNRPRRLFVSPGIPRLRFPRMLFLISCAKLSLKQALVLWLM